METPIADRRFRITYPGVKDEAQAVIAETSAVLA
jgi:hypothetical protein